MNSLAAHVAASAIVLLFLVSTPAHAQRVFGLDTSSAANFNVTQTQWNNAYNNGYATANIPSFEFAFIRSTHGGTNGMSPALDDAQFYQNITRATTAGMLAGSYHYPHPAVYTAADEAQHWLNYAGMYMRPGYLIPVFDLEGTDASNLTTSALTTWCNQFIDAINAAKGFNPIVYTNSSFNNDEVSASIAFTNVASSPHTGDRTYQWLARPGGDITTGQPQPALPTYPDPYGVWDPNFTTRSASSDPVVKPWAFWQNGSAHIDPSGSSGNQFLIDFDAANGNIEFVRDFLVPALWTGSSGNWTTVSNWNSDNPGYIAGNITTGPAPRLPGYDDTNATLANRKYDWVKLQNTNNATVTLSSGAQGVRKFYTSQPLNITGGSLTVNYIPGSGGKWDLPSEFNDAVTISGSAAYTAHTTQVDAVAGVFNINGGTVTFRSLNLVSDASTPGKIVMGGNVTFADFDGTSTAVIRSTGALAQAGRVDLGSANRTFTITDGSAATDVSIQTAIIGTGGLTKAGAGALQLTGTNTYTGTTTISAGTLELGSGSTTGSLDNTGGIVNNSALIFNRSNAYTYGGAISGTGTLTKNGTNTLTLAGISSYSGNTIINTGTLQYSALANLGAASSSIVFGGSGILRPTAGVTETRNVVFNANGTIDIPVDSTFSGVLSGLGNFSKTSAGTLTLSNDNTGTGSTTVSAGTLQIGNGGTTGSVASTSIFNFGALSFNRSNDLTYSGVISQGGTLTKLGAGTLTLTGANTFTGSTTVSAGALQIGNGGTTGSLANQGGIINNSAVIFNRSDAASYGGAISGSGSVTNAGTGTYTLSGGNSYAGNTNINAGVLQYNVTSNLGAASNSIVFNGGTLRTLAAGSQARNVTLNAGNGAIDTNGFNSTFSGNFSGVGGLIKIGSGSLTLTGTNNFSGGTSVSAGRVILSGASTSLGSGYVTVLGDTANTALEIQNGVGNTIADAATLSLLGGGTAGTADQGFADLGSGVSEIVASLLLGGVAQSPGTYGSTLSGAMFQNNEYFAGTGMIVVPALGDYNGDFNASAADYVTWRKDNSIGAPNGYQTWRTNFGQSTAATAALSGPSLTPSLAASLVPEPSSIALLLLGIGATLVHRRARSCR